MASLVYQDPREMMVLLGKLVLQGPLDNQEHPVTLEPMACQESLELRDILVLPVFLVHRGHLDLRVRMAMMVKMVR